MGSFSLWHWLIVLLIVVLVFGTKKLRNIGGDVGGAGGVGAGAFGAGITAGRDRHLFEGLGDRFRSQSLQRGGSQGHRSRQGMQAETLVGGRLTGVERAPSWAAGGLGRMRYGGHSPNFNANDSHL